MKRIPLIAAFLISANLASGAMTAALSQEKPQPKLTINSMSFYPIPEGFYNASINITLQAQDKANVGFGVNINHVKTIDEALEKLKPEVDKLAAQIMEASEDFEKHH